MLHKSGKWESVRVNSDLKKSLDKFKDSYMYKSNSEIVEKALEEFMYAKIQGHYHDTIMKLTHLYHANREDYVKLGLHSLEQFMDWLVAKGEGNLNLMFSEQLKAIKDEMDQTKKALDRLEKNKTLKRY